MHQSWDVCDMGDIMLGEERVTLSAECEITKGVTHLIKNVATRFSVPLT